jgi:hypothetical protein
LKEKVLLVIFVSILANSIILRAWYFSEPRKTEMDRLYHQSKNKHLENYIKKKSHQVQQLKKYLKIRENTRVRKDTEKIQLP